MLVLAVPFLASLLHGRLSFLLPPTSSSSHQAPKIVSRRKVTPRKADMATANPALVPLVPGENEPAQDRLLLLPPSARSFRLRQAAHSRCPRLVSTH